MAVECLHGSLAVGVTLSPLRLRPVFIPDIHLDFKGCSAEGRRMLVLHGDEFDSVVKCSPWLARSGSTIYDLLLAANPEANADLLHLAHERLDQAEAMKARIMAGIDGDEPSSRFDVSSEYPTADTRAPAATAARSSETARP